jgi:DNA-directed RNA polymerase subunit H (RpoH/RPB5)
MQSDVLDLIVRSRPTILEILENRGYDVDAYKGVSPEEIFKLAVGSQELLKITAPKKDGSNAPLDRAVVIYWVDGAVRHKIDKEIAKLWDAENPEHYDHARDELIIILSEPQHEIFHAAAARQYSANKARVSFFQLKNIITNPARHIFVPPHRKLSSAEATDVLKALHAVSKSQLPNIKFHVDKMARVLGLVPGDIVEIKRPSETAGIYKYYRVCTV